MFLLSKEGKLVSPRFKTKYDSKHKGIPPSPQTMIRPSDWQQRWKAPTERALVVELVTPRGPTTLTPKAWSRLLASVDAAIPKDQVTMEWNYLADCTRHTQSTASLTSLEETYGGPVFRLFHHDTKAMYLIRDVYFYQSFSFQETSSCPGSEHVKPRIRVGATVEWLPGLAYAALCPKAMFPFPKMKQFLMAHAQHTASLKTHWLRILEVTTSHQPSLTQLPAFWDLVQRLCFLQEFLPTLPKTRIVTGFTQACQDLNFTTMFHGLHGALSLPLFQADLQQLQATVYGLSRPLPACLRTCFESLHCILPIDDPEIQVPCTKHETGPPITGTQKRHPRKDKRPPQPASLHASSKRQKVPPRILRKGLRHFF